MIENSQGIGNGQLPFFVFEWSGGRAGDKSIKGFLVHTLTMLSSRVEPAIGSCWVLPVYVDHVAGCRIDNPCMPNEGVSGSGFFNANFYWEPIASMQRSGEIHTVAANVVFVQFCG